MSLLDRILTKAAPVVTTDLQRVGTQAPAVRRSVGVDGLLRAYSASELAYACIQVKRKAMQDPRLIVEEKQRDGTWKESPGHPMQRLLMRPLVGSATTPGIDGAAFMGLHVASMDIANVFYAEKVRSKAGAIVGLNPLNPAYMQPWLNAERQQVGYTWRRGGQTVNFPYEDLLVRTNPDWSDASPLSVALNAVDADAAQLGFIRAFFNNGGQPSGILKKKGMLKGPEEAAQIQDKWSSKYGRRGDGQHRPAVLDDNMDYTRIGSNLDELASDKTVAIFESRICMAFGVPPLVVYSTLGLMRATYSNLKEAWSNFWDAELSPMLKAYREFLTWNLLTEFVSEDLIYGERIRLRWDLSQVAALQEDVDALHTRARNALSAGGITLNEYRSAIGQSPDAAGDYYLRGMAITAESAGEAPTDPATETAKRAAFTRQYKARSIETIERQMEKTMQRYLAAEYRKAAAAVGG